MPADAWRVVAELAATRHGVATRSLAASLGLTARHIRSALDAGFVHEPLHGVLVFSGHPATWQQRLAMVTSAGGGHAVVSHRAAALLHRFDGLRNAGVEVSLARPLRLRLPQSLDDTIVHHVHRLEPRDIVSCEGLPVTNIARTLVDFAGVTDDEAVWRALIDLRRRKVNPRWLAETATRLHRPGQSGTKRVMRALQRWEAQGVLPDSWLEELLHRIVDDPSLPALVRQHEVRDASGRFVARLDLAFPSVRLGLEGHSRQFHFGPLAGAADEDRDLRLAACGWEVLYLGWYATKHPAEVLDLIREVVRQREV